MDESEPLTSVRVPPGMWPGMPRLPGPSLSAPREPRTVLSSAGTTVPVLTGRLYSLLQGHPLHDVSWTPCSHPPTLLWTLQAPHSDSCPEESDMHFSSLCSLCCPQCCVSPWGRVLAGAQNPPHRRYLRRAYWL